MRLIRVFPRRTAMTPRDGYAFVGDPPMFQPPADAVHVSATFIWDREEAQRLGGAWAQYYEDVRVGGPAFGDIDGEFTPGVYVAQGVVFTTRGCNKQCPWCLVPLREGKLREIPVTEGHIVQDNNLLQANWRHIAQVFDMLRCQGKAAVFSGGLDSALISDWIAEELRDLRIEQIFLAADTKAALRPLRKAVAKLSFLPREKLRCYVLIAYGNETVDQAEARLREVWEIGCMPFAQLYQPLDRHIDYSGEWRDLNRTWSRPAAMKTLMAKQTRPS